MCKPTYVLSKNSKKVLLTQMHRQWMLHNFCEVATDFPDLLRKLRDPLNMRESEIVVQFPFVLPVTEEKTEEELARITEKRKEQGRKLQEIAAKTRLEKVRLSRYLSVLCSQWPYVL